MSTSLGSGAKPTAAAPLTTPTHEYIRRRIDITGYFAARQAFHSLHPTPPNRCHWDCGREAKERRPRIAAASCGWIRGPIRTWPVGRVSPGAPQDRGPCRHDCMVLGRACSTHGCSSGTEFPVGRRRSRVQADEVNLLKIKLRRQRSRRLSSRGHGGRRSWGLQVEGLPP